MNAHGPRAFRTKAEPDVLDGGKSLRALVGLYVTHLEAGAVSARGLPYAAKTVLGYKEALETFVRTSEALGLPDNPRKLTAAMIERYAQVLRARGLKPKTVSDRVGPLSPFLRWLLDRGVLAHNPLDGFRMPKGKVEPVKPFSGEEIQALLDGCDSRTWMGCRNAAVLWTLLDTGMRADELVRLALSDLDQHDWTLTIRFGKGGKQRTARLGLQARRYVGDFLVLWRGASAGPLFPSRFALPMQRNGLTQMVSKLGKSTGVSHAHPHKFRHTFAVQFLRAGGDPFRLQILLGHASLEMSRRYSAFLSMEDALNAHHAASPADTMGLRGARRNPLARR